MTGAMKGTVNLKKPLACSQGERLEFARLVVQGFQAATESLDGRILDAKWFAFYHSAGEMLGAIAAIKAPKEPHRDDIFKKAGAPVSPSDYALELGWVYVVPTHRGMRIAENLCRRLLVRLPASRVFATTRRNNISMIRIGFERVGQPYPRRDEELVLFLRPPPTITAPCRDACWEHDGGQIEGLAEDRC